MTKPTTPQGSAETLFAQGKADFAKEDWLAAIGAFEQVRVQAPASPMAAEATYLEAMARYDQDMFAGAAVDFRAVRRSYPASDFAPRAQYMVGESYYQTASRPELDQTYTILALTEFQNFLHDFPTAPQSLLDSAQNRIKEIRGDLAKKYLLAAQEYDKLDNAKSAKIYYQRVLDNFYDTPSAPEAELRVAEIDVDQKKMDDARTALEAFDTKYLQTASSSERKRAETLHSKLPNP